MIRDEFLARANAVARLVGVTAPDIHPEVLRAAGTSLSRYWLSPSPPTDPLTLENSARGELLRAQPSVQSEKSGERVATLELRKPSCSIQITLSGRLYRLPDANKKQDC